MPEAKEFEKTFFKILTDIKPYLHHFVIAGGWIPYIYSKYLWKNLSVLPVSTLDIDIGVREVIPPWKNKTLFSKLGQLKYKLEPVYSKEPFPLVPIFIDERKGFEMRIEFITSFYVSDDAINKFLGREIAIHRIDEFDWLLNQVIELKILFQGQTIKLNVPQPHIYLFHKGLTFLMREDDIKQAKDLYYLYYILRFHPKYDELINKLKCLKKEVLFNVFTRNLSESFDSEVSEGPLKIESISGFDPYVSSIRKDAHERINKLIIDLK